MLLSHIQYYAIILYMLSVGEVERGVGVGIDTSSFTVGALLSALARDDRTKIDAASESSQMTDEFFIPLLSTTIPALRNLAENLEEGLLANRWNVIIGDDTSGRLPALFVKRLAENASEDFRQGSKARLQFVAGGYEPCSNHKAEDLRDVTSRVASLSTKPGSSALVVTELCRKGLGVTPIIRALASQGIDCDLATVYSYSSAEKLKQNIEDDAESGDVGIFIGSEEPHATFNDIKYAASGVRKVRGKSLSAYSHDGSSHASMATARHFLYDLADNLYETAGALY
jgi:hypothetical protein